MGLVKVANIYIDANLSCKCINYSCLRTNNAFPDDGVTIPKYVGALLMLILM